MPEALSSIDVDGTVTALEVQAGLHKLTQKLDADATAVRATADAQGNDIVATYATIAAVAGKEDAVTGAATSILRANLAASKALVSDASGKVADSQVSATELGYLVGVTGAIQAQIDAKLDADAIAARASADSAGNIITDTYATKQALSSGLGEKLDVGATAAKALADAQGRDIVATYATITGLGAYQPLSARGQANGYAPLDASGDVPIANIKTGNASGLIPLLRGTLKDGQMAVYSSSAGGLVGKDIGTVYRPCGSVATYADLPDDALPGDVYNVTAAYGTYPPGTNFGRTEQGTWDSLGGSFDTSNLATKAEVSAKADLSTVTAHTGNGTIHITASERSAWNNKQGKITGGATSIVTDNLTANRALVSDAFGKVKVSAVTATELGYLDGVTSGIQAQLNAKVPTSRTINGKKLTGNITLTKSDISLGNVDNTADVNKPLSTAMQNALDGKADNSNVPRAVWSGDVALNPGMMMSQATYFGGGSDSGTLFVLTFYCTGNGAWEDTCVAVPIEQHSGFASVAEFTIPSDRGAPERGRVQINWSHYPDAQITVVQAAQISSTGGTNWGDASGRFHLIQVTRINPA